MKSKFAHILANGFASVFTVAAAHGARVDWVAVGTFTDNTVLALAGAVSNEVYGRIP